MSERERGGYLGQVETVNMPTVFDNLVEKASREVVGGLNLPVIFSEKSPCRLEGTDVCLGRCDNCPILSLDFFRLDHSADEMHGKFKDAMPNGVKALPFFRKLRGTLIKGNEGVKLVFPFGEYRSGDPVFYLKLYESQIV
ncbi:hypothetical protein DRH14_01590 [Candidatus Shapirobacteria bacterium]|nr:MAG: hypothetical protein DRH14_01590 [Candidatus Shapirobacteria bacterium]